MSGIFTVASTQTISQKKKKKKKLTHAPISLTLTLLPADCKVVGKDWSILPNVRNSENNNCTHTHSSDWPVQVHICKDENVAKLFRC